MPESLSFYLVAFPAILIAGISKGGFGGGLVVIAVPLMSLVISPIQAAGIMLPLLIVMDLATIKSYWKDWRRDIIKKIVPYATIGILLATLVFSFLNIAWIKIFNASIALMLPLHYFWNYYARKVESPPRDKGGFLWSSLSGFTSFVAHAGGPPINMYLLPMKLPKSQFVGTIVVFFLTTNLLKSIPYSFLGQYNPESLKLSLFLMPIAFIGARLGVWLHHKVNEMIFYHVCYSFLFITGLKLFYDGVSGL
jgi:uncharacterized membrane protein YfcA